MGLPIRETAFTTAHFEAFDERLHRGLRALAQVLERSDFGTGETTLGAELEVSLIDPNARPALVNEAVRDSAQDDRITHELDRFNLELNLQPMAMAGRPFSRLADAMSDSLATLRVAAAKHDARVVTLGILPTLELSDLRASSMTKTPRYIALSEGLRKARGGAFQIHIAGADELQIESEEVTLEGANTSLQLHLKVAPNDFVDTYNAAQLATLPSLALAGNSPTFLGRSLWEETRIALFKQSVDARRTPSIGGFPAPRVSYGHGWLRESAYELFEQSVMLHSPLIPVCDSVDPLEQLSQGEVPHLEELKLHHGTVWRWNRAVYDHTDNGHIRIELRTLPSGPTVADMVANAAYLLGLTLGLRTDAARLVNHIPFEHARWSFYRAAQRGLDAELLWPSAGPPSPRKVNARELARELLFVAEQGLLAAGVERDEAQRWLQIIDERLRRGQTGSVWQRATLASIEKQGLSRPQAMQQLLERYVDNMGKQLPVHSWPTE